MFKFKTGVNSFYNDYALKAHHQANFNEKIINGLANLDENIDYS